MACVLARVAAKAKSQELKTVLEKKQTGGDCPSGCFLSNAFLPERGRRRRFHQHPREDFLRELCEFPLRSRRSKAFNRGTPETTRSPLRTHPSPPQPGYAQRPRRSETLLSHYRTRRSKNRIQG